MRDLELSFAWSQVFWKFMRDRDGMFSYVLDDQVDASLTWQGRILVARNRPASFSTNIYFVDKNTLCWAGKPRREHMWYSLFSIRTGLRARKLSFGDFPCIGSSAAEIENYPESQALIILGVHVGARTLSVK